MLANDITFQRRKDAISSLGKNEQRGATNRMVNVLFNGLPPAQAPTRKMPAVPAERTLNESQEEAISLCLRSQDVAVIHGPPGTGKTTTVVELIRRAVELGEKVLACAPSNIAVDNMVERLAKLKVNVVRVGHPARLLPEVIDYSLDAICAKGDAAAILKDVRADMNQNVKAAATTRDKAKRRELRAEFKELRKEVRIRERKAIDQIIQTADVVCCTTAGAATKKLRAKEGGWDLVVIDECAQALEADCWIPLSQGARCVLAGDHKQLPPTIKSEAAKKGLETTLMDRVVAMHPSKCVVMLEVQYRMHGLISQWSSQEFYEGRLKADSTVATHLLAGLGLDANEDNNVAASVLIDTAGSDCMEDEVEQGQSKRNKKEAVVVLAHAKALMEGGLDGARLAIITPYNAQVELLRELSREEGLGIEVNTVDGFQGREKEAIIISLVRSNPRGEVGFLAEPRRLNVAITRAKRHLAIVGDSDTMRSDPFLGRMVDYFEAATDEEANHAEVRSAAEYGALPNPGYKPPESRGKKGKAERGEDKAAKAKAAWEAVVGTMPVIPANAGAGSEGDEGGYSELEEAMLREQLQERLERFKRGKEGNHLTFSTDLNSFQRRIVHDVCEATGLGHTSLGQDKARFISVSLPGVSPPILPGTSQVGTKEVIMEKKCPPLSATEVAEAARIDREAEAEKALAEMEEREAEREKEAARQEIKITPNAFAGLEGDSEEEADEALLEEEASPPAPEEVKPVEPALPEGHCKCEACGKVLPRMNLVLHQAYCERVKMNEASRAKAESSASAEKLQKKKVKKQKAKVGGSGEEEDLDSILAEYRNDYCWAKGCKKDVGLMGKICDFCGQKFCLPHLMPEMHGCGDAAKEKARAGFKTDFKKFQGGTGKMDDRKRATLQNKLKSGISEKAGSRTADGGGGGSGGGKKNNKKKKK